MDIYARFLKDYENGLLENDHTSYVRKYVSRKAYKGLEFEGEVSEYEGRFGKGYTVDRPNWNSRKYSFRTYYIYK